MMKYIHFKIGDCVLLVTNTDIPITGIIRYIYSGSDGSIWYETEYLAQENVNEYPIISLFEKKDLILL